MKRQAAEKVLATCRLTMAAEPRLELIRSKSGKIEYVISLGVSAGLDKHEEAHEENLKMSRKELDKIEEDKKK